MATVDFTALDDTALAGVISDIQDALAARNTDLQDDPRPAAKNLIAHRRYALTALDQAAGRLRLCAAHPLERVAERPRVPRIEDGGEVHQRANGLPPGRYHP